MEQFCGSTRPHLPHDRCLGIIDAAGCGPHTVVELPEPCCPDNPAARCVACRDGNPEHCTAPTYEDTVERWGKTL